MPTKKIVSDLKQTPLLRPAKRSDRSLFSQFVHQLYREDQNIPIDSKYPKRTFEEFFRRPEKGSIFIIEENQQPIGYVLLVPFWANEYGGNVLSIDEIFIVPAYRNRGIGTAVITSIQNRRLYKAVGLYLVTTPNNKRARRLYKKIGFEPYEYPGFFYEYPKRPLVDRKK